MYYTWDDLFWLFVIYSFLGWCAGVIANALRRKRFINTGFFNLPLCPIYGFIGIGYSIFLPELKHRFFFLFLGGAVVALLVIVVTGALLEHVFNRKWWDYSQARFQFQGYITYTHLLFFGLGAIACIWILNPFFLDLVHLLPGKVEDILEIGLGILVLADGICCVVTVTQFRRLTMGARFMDYVQDITEDFGNALTRRVQRRMAKAYPNLQAETVGTGWERKAQEKDGQKKEESQVFAQGCCFYKLAGLFFLGAFLGDITETIFCRVTAGVWMSRSSVVWGPFSIVWGLGCAFLTAFLYRYREKSDRYVFLCGTVLGGAYEYFCSVFTELVFGTVFWDYSEIPFNLGGRINLLYCFFWGIAAVVWLKILYPVFSGWIERLPLKAGKILIWAAVVFMAADMLVSAMALYRYQDRVGNPSADNRLEAFLDQHFDNNKIERIYPNAKLVEEE
ncbi:MAG TPA: putative ABC transporter permease [Candidatus Blautia pullicola]|jgi:uncharacterized membrane protein|uniref:ABC transporter permease n=1 Tax=Candidatus Blautia pullicola TaxID=2838498 RepID=A0A9D2FSC9_9FIRM|nr:putative ABC transporter permease [Candidatus Blautia pullicola]